MQIAPALQEPVVGVVGGRGGVGASLFTAAVAAAGARRGRTGRSVLVDLEAGAGGIDVLLGVEAVPGTRWSGLRLSGGHLPPSLLVQGLPRWGSVSVLAADIEPRAQDVRQLIAAAAAVGPVSVELGRAPTPAREAALALCDLVCLLTRADVVSVTAARTAVLALRAQGLRAPLGVVPRRCRFHADPARVAELVGGELIASLPADDGLDSRDPLDVEALPRSVWRVATGVLDALIGVERVATVGGGRHA